MKSPPKGGPTVLSLSSGVAKGLLPKWEGVLCRRENMHARHLHSRHCFRML